MLTACCRQAAAAGLRPLQQAVLPALTFQITSLTSLAGLGGSGGGACWRPAAAACSSRALGGSPSSSLGLLLPGPPQLAGGAAQPAWQPGQQRRPIFNCAGFSGELSKSHHEKKLLGCACVCLRACACEICRALRHAAVLGRGGRRCASPLPRRRCPHATLALAAPAAQLVASPGVRCGGGGGALCAVCAVVPAVDGAGAAAARLPGGGAGGRVPAVCGAVGAAPAAAGWGLCVCKTVCACVWLCVWL